MPMNKVYLDYNATTPLYPEVATAMLETYQQPLNASSVHAFGREAKKLLESARKKVADAVGAATTCPVAYQVVFTGNGTEANNLALKGIKNVTRIVSATEHPSVLKAAKAIDDNYQVIPVDAQGIVNLNTLERILKEIKGKGLVSVMLANNETGVIQPLKEITYLAHAHGALVHTDAVQAVGRMEISMAELDVDMLTISAHKLGGPQGAAALVIRKNIPLAAQLQGGGQELGFRAGTENIAAIHGFGIAAEKAQASLQTIPDIQHLRDMLEQGITAFAPDAVIVGRNSNRLPNTSCIIMPGVKSETQLIHFDLAGIAVSAGSACSSGKVDASHVLLAMGIDQEAAACALRISLGYRTTEDDVKKCIVAWKTLYTRLYNSQQAA